MSGAVTIATNMAGRGTDIQLGGNIDMLIKQQQDEEKDKSKLIKMEKTLREKVAADKEIVKAAEIFSANKDWQRTIEFLEKAEKRFPNSPLAPQIKLNLAYAYKNFYRDEEAIAMLDKFIISYPNHPALDYAYYLKGVQSRNVELMDIFRGIMPFLAIVILAMVLMYWFPGIALWLPETLFAN